MDIVGRIFGGTIRDRRSKIKDRNQEKDNINFVFNFGLKSELKENENPTEENCTELKIKPTEKAKKHPKKSTKSSPNLEDRFSFSLKNKVDQPTLRPMSTNDKKRTVEIENVTL